MGVTATPTQGLRRQLRIEPLGIERAAVWLIGFLPITYLALSGGGYDIVARSEIAVLIWWVVLLGVCVGVLPRHRFSRGAWVALALLAGFFVWTWLAVTWTSSQEQTLAELGRVGAYLGMLVLGLSIMRRRNRRPLVCGLAAAVALVAGLAVLSRLVPSWFPSDPTANLYATSPLLYPFDYSDGVGEFAALGLPLLLYVATGARTLVARAAGAAALPVIVLCLGLTVSRGGILAAAVGVCVFYALAPNRIPKLLTGLVAAAGSAIVMLELLHLAGVRDAFAHPAPASQRHSMLIVLVVVCLVVAVAQAGLTLAARHYQRPGWLILSPRQALLISAAIAVTVLAVVIVGIAAGTAHHLWTEFKQPNPPPAGNQYSRLLSVAGSHRYQYWAVALDAFRSSPWKGIGPGTFQFYWAQHQTLGEYVRNAHSLWIETLAELGIVGIALIVGFFAFAMIDGGRRAFRASEPDRLARAAAVAGIAAFCAAAAFDWVWQIGVMPLIAMLLVAVAIGGDGPRWQRNSQRTRWQTAPILLIACLGGLWAIAVPLASTLQVRSSQAAVRHRDYRTALNDAATAENVEPSAATPRLQRALILEQLGDIPGASVAVAEAAAREPTSSQIWLVASRIATEANRPRLALAYYQRAKALDPTSPIFHS